MNDSALVLVHPHFNPRAGRANAPTEYDVLQGLRRLGYRAEIAAVAEDVRALDRQLAAVRPGVVFNLLEEFRGEAVYDFNLVAYLEALGIPCTGCNPRSLAVTRNKRWTSALLEASGLRVPRENVLPAIVKFNREHASLGLTKTSVVRNRAGLARATARMRALSEAEILCQEFIAGREVTVSVWGNRRVEAFDPWCLHLPDVDAIATEKVKFDRAYRHAQGIRSARLRDVALGGRLRKQAVKAYRTLEMNGYARFDFRVRADGEAYLIDVNANPCLAKDEDFARAANRPYVEVLERLIALAREYRPRF